MDVKYTFRDLIVYLLTGFTCMVLVLIVKPQIVDLVLESKYMKDTNRLTLAFIGIGIPALYIIGHVIQIFDLIISFYLARPLKKFKWNEKYKSKRYFAFRWLYYFFAASTAEFQYEKRGITPDDFNKQKYTVIVDGKNNTAEYYYLVRELFNGLRVFTFLFIIYMLLFENVNSQLILIYTVLYFLFWVKAYNSAKNYTYEITKVYKIMNNKIPGQ